MAKVVENYSANLTERGYIYSSPDIYSSKTQYESGTALTLPADYDQRMSDIFYPVNAPYGWVQWHIVGNITPNYKTVTDACSPPTSITLSGSTLTISGGAGGDLNTFQGYQISWRDANIGTSSYGAWSSDVTVSSSNTTVTYGVSAPAGKTRQFRARTIGSAGGSYYSAYVTCGATLTGNTGPSAPAIYLPAGGAGTYSKTPVIKLMIQADADGDTLTIKRQIDSGGWTNITTQKSGLYYDRLPSLGIGNHTIRYKAADSYAESGNNSITITVVDHSWKRTITTGTVISNGSISHVADINEMLAAVNMQRAFYSMSAISLPGTVGRFGDWKAQMDRMLTSIKECGVAANLSLSFNESPAYPTASTVNAIRQWTKEF